MSVNSISGSLNADTIVATARMLRSAKKEILLIVEGDDDIALFSHALGLPRANFISCFGKERLMEVYDLVPRKGLDHGTVLIRDADCDGITSHEKDGVLLLTSDNYDFEMSLLPKRVFGRIFSEYLKTKSSPELADEAFKKMIEAASLIGALRFISHSEDINIKFQDAKLSFVNHKTLNVDLKEMVRYFLSRSKLSTDKVDDIVERVLHIAGSSSDKGKITCGKDFLKILSIALNRHYKCCNSTECTFEILARIFRITVTHDDIKELSMYPLLVSQVQKSGMAWTGFQL